jgi:tight adherence protein B
VILLAATSIGVFWYLLAGLLLGRPVRFRRWRPRPHAGPARELWLQQAGVHVTPLQFWATSSALGVAAFLVVWFVTRTPPIAAVLAVFVAGLPCAYYARRRRACLRALQDAWPDGLRDLAASIAAGRSLSQAVVDLATSGPVPLRDAFARFASLAQMVGTTAALEAVADEVADPTTDRILEVLILAHERGGGIVSGILEDLVAVTTKDVKVLDEIDTEGLEMKINARAVLVLPWLVLVALTRVSFAY